MAIPDYQTLMLPVLRLSAGGEQRVAEPRFNFCVTVVNNSLRVEEERRMCPQARHSTPIIGDVYGAYATGVRWIRI